MVVQGYSGDEVDVHCSQYFVNSSLALVVLFRRRLKSVADVTQSWWDALLVYWGAVCRHGPCGLVSSLCHGIGGFLLSGFLIPWRR